MYYKDYNSFWLERLSYGKVREFTKEEIRWAIKQIEQDKYFGYYELSENQRIAVDVLVWVAEEILRLNDQLTTGEEKLDD